MLNTLNLYSTKHMTNKALFGGFQERYIHPNEYYKKCVAQSLTCKLSILYNTVQLQFFLADTVKLQCTTGVHTFFSLSDNDHLQKFKRWINYDNTDIDMLVEHRANRGCQFKEYLTAVQITDHKPHIRLKK